MGANSLPKTVTGQRRGSDLNPDPNALFYAPHGGSVAEWLACWTQAQKGPGSNRSCDAKG